MARPEHDLLERAVRACRYAGRGAARQVAGAGPADRKPGDSSRNRLRLGFDGQSFAAGRRRYSGWRRGRSEEHTSELQSLMRISYAVFFLTTQKNKYFIIS